MISEKIQSAINEQINQELFSAYIYYSMAAHAASRGFNGFASWLHVQAQEELTHANKLYGFIIDRGGVVKLESLAAPQSQWDSMLAVFEHAAQHEKGISARINRLVELARGEKDTAAEVFLHWFVNEQVEEEKNADDLVLRIRMVGPSVGSLLYLDKEAGKRKAGGE